jgi:hypothetical protein
MHAAASTILCQQALYNRLDALSPVFEGPWRWVMVAVIALPVAVVAWAIVGQRWRPDGVRRCPRCAHEFDPTASFAAPAGVRCGECGTVTHDARRALRRRGRWAVAAIAAASAVVLATPYLLWQGAHAAVAAALLPRWVESERAALADGTVVARQVDPVHAWLGWDPPAGGPPRWANRYPGWRDSERVMVGVPGVHGGAPAVEITDIIGPPPYAFGAMPSAAGWASPALPEAGAPGFGGDLNGDGRGDVVIGSINTGTLGGIVWGAIDAGATTESAVIRELGDGIFRRDEAHGDWTFVRRCMGFRYNLTPGAFAQDLGIVCTWDRARGAWVEDAARMRRPADVARLAAQAHAARTAFDGCLRDADKSGRLSDAQQPTAMDAALAALREGRAGEGDFLPCPEMVGAVLGGVQELLVSGHGQEWEEWVRVSWPDGATASFRDRFIHDVRRAIDGSGCAAFLKELNGLR